MLSKNKVFTLLITLIISFTFYSSAKTQEIPEDPNQPIIDTIDIQENLLDSNQVYKKQFDSLSKDGEWLKTKKSDLIRDLDNIAEEDLYLDYGEDDYVYVWRPYGINSYWNPYYNGCWIFSSYGWMWNSYYSWGWGPYNYGRWYFSSFYGWTWFPGNVWAPNWVTWRNCNNYVGWYPTCPRFYWRNSGYQICSNYLFTSAPANWVFVDKKNFTKKIDPTTVAGANDNVKLLKNSKKLKTSLYAASNEPKIKYSGPDVNVISKESGEQITPIRVTVTKSDENRYEYVKNENVVSTKDNVNTTKNANPTTTKSSVTKTREGNPTTKSPTTKTKDSNKKTKLPQIKTNDNNTKNKSGNKKTQRGNTKTQTRKGKSNKLVNIIESGYPTSDIPPENIPVKADSENQNESSTEHEETIVNYDAKSANQSEGNKNEIIGNAHGYFQKDSDIK